MKHRIIKKTLLTIGISLSIVNSHLSIAQRSLGVSGLLNIPSADMQEDGTFMAGGNYLPQEMLPREWGYNSGNYFVNLTFLPFMEVAYRCTLLKVESTGKWNQDRSVSLRLRPLKEGKWWPSVVIGSNDLLTTGELNPFLDSGGNRYFSSVYAVGTKHFGFYGHDIGVTVGGHVPFRSKSENKGVFGGVSYRPAFLKPLEVMAEYDSKAVNMGVSARLFDHFSLYAYCYDFKTVAGGIRYELTPRQRVFNPDEVRMPWDGRVELVLYPQITLNNSWLDKIYGAVINIAPAVEARLWKGAAFTGQVILPVWNNMVGQMDYVRAGVLTLSQEFGLPGGAFGRVTVGNFTNNRMGADLKLRYATPDDRWMFGVEGGVTGSSTFYEGKWQVSAWKRVSGAAEVRFRERRFNMDFNLGVHRYIYGDYGVRVDCIRHFGRTTAGLYAMYTGGEANGGFHFAVPLPQWGKSRKVRVRLPEYYQMEYSGQSGLEYFRRKLGQDYETRPDESNSVPYDRRRDDL